VTCLIVPIYRPVYLWFFTRCIVGLEGEGVVCEVIDSCHIWSILRMTKWSITNVTKTLIRCVGEIRVHFSSVGKIWIPKAQLVPHGSLQLAFLTSRVSSLPLTLIYFTDSQFDPLICMRQNGSTSCAITEPRPAMWVVPVFVLLRSDTRAREKSKNRWLLLSNNDEK
jgi:hypothetical protein